MGEPHASDNGKHSGVVQVFRKVGGAWEHRQRLALGGGSAQRAFGTSLAAMTTSPGGEELLFIGGPCEVNDCGGKVLLFRYDPQFDAWLDTNQVLSPFSINSIGFGKRLAVGGDVVMTANNGGDLEFFQDSDGWLSQGGLQVGLSKLADIAVWETVAVASDTVAVHVYRDFSGWVEDSSSKLSPPPGFAATQTFGASLSMRKNWLAVGCPPASAGDGGGEVLFYKRNAPNDPTVFGGPTGLKHGDPGAAIGGKVALNELGDEAALVVQKGASYSVVFARDNGGKWQILSELTLPTSIELGVGALALGGSTALVGAPDSESLGKEAGAATLLEKNNEQWSEASPLPLSREDLLNSGESVAVDGDWMAIGMPGYRDEQRAGAVEVLRRDAAGMFQRHSLLLPSNPQQDGRFGARVALVGNRLAVSAPEQGSVFYGGEVYLFGFNQQTNAWEQTDKIAPAQLNCPDTSTIDVIHFGDSLAFDGKTLAVGAPQAHACGQDFTFTGLSFLYEVSPAGAAALKGGPIEPPQSGGTWGIVAVGGGDAAIGAPMQNNFSGVVHPYVNESGSWSALGTTIPSPDGLTFGAALSMAPAGGSLLVGAPTSAGQQAAGKVHLYERSNNAWAKRYSVDGPYLGFGSSVVLRDGLALVGSPLEDGNPASTSRAYFYVDDGVTLAQGPALDTKAPVDPDGIGVALALQARPAGGWPAVAVVSSPLGQSTVVWQLNLDSGEACSGDGACDSGFCVDGVCCNTFCGGGDPQDCQSCDGVDTQFIDETGPKPAPAGVCGIKIGGVYTCHQAQGACDVAAVCQGTLDTCPAPDTSKTDGDPCPDPPGGVCGGGVCTAQGGAGQGGSAGEAGAGGAGEGGSGQAGAGGSGEAGQGGAGAGGAGKGGAGQAGAGEGGAGEGGAGEGGSGEGGAGEGGAGEGGAGGAGEGGSGEGGAGQAGQVVAPRPPDIWPGAEAPSAGGAGGAAGAGASGGSTGIGGGVVRPAAKKPPQVDAQQSEPDCSVPVGPKGGGLASVVSLLGMIFASRSRRRSS